MKELLYGIVELLAKIHSYLLRFNDAYEYNFSDIAFFSHWNFGNDVYFCGVSCF